MNEVGPLPLRDRPVSKLSTPWIDRLCLTLMLIISYIIFPFISELIEIYVGAYSNFITVFLLIIAVPLIGNLISINITNYFIIK
ncbi:MAG: hypothetical protein ACI9EM_000040 [Candidatus Thalassarchaeaceae archaeon]